MAHKKYMDQAINQAKKAYAADEVPIGAVVVDQNGKILSRAYNKMTALKCQTGHAEVLAIQKACKKIGDWRLNDCWIYITLEPCPMCFGLIELSRLKGIVFGTTSPLFGYGYGKNKNLPLYAKDLVIKEGVRAEECKELLQQFFKNVRQRKD